MGNWYIERINIDSREKNRGKNAYNYFMDYDLQVKQLPYGDYLFETTTNKRIIYEYKTCEDFINSMSNKTLFQEISNQSINFQYSYLIIEGDFEETIKELYFKVPNYRYQYKTLKMMKSSMRKQVKGALERLYSMYVPIIFVETEEEAFDRMLNIVKKIDDDKRYGDVVRPTPKYLSNNPCVLYLSSVKGISDKLSNRICDKLDIVTLYDLLNVSIEDLASVDGISVKKANNIYSYLHNQKVE